MSNDHTVRRSRAGLKSAKADWRGFDALTDRDIEAAVRDDPDAAPLVDESWFDQARFVAPPARRLSISGSTGMCSTSSSRKERVTRHG